MLLSHLLKSLFFLNLTAALTVRAIGVFNKIRSSHLRSLENPVGVVIKLAYKPIDMTGETA